MGKHCEAVELLLARMDSNPEEFEEGGRWEKLIVKYRTYLPVKDRTAMEDKINALRLDTFHKAVMSELLAETREDTISFSDLAVAMSAGRTTTSINLSQQSIKDIAAAMSQYAANTWKP
jgi:hypothetical protein